MRPVVPPQYDLKAVIVSTVLTAGVVCVVVASNVISPPGLLVKPEAAVTPLVNLKANRLYMLLSTLTNVLTPVVFSISAAGILGVKKVDEYTNVSSV